MNCDRCQNQATYSRKYSGENLCSECFSNSILQKIARTISKRKMIKNNELVCVGVSGGKDSHFQVYYIKEVMKMNPVLLSCAPLDWTETGRNNLENLSDTFSCDIISFTTCIKES